MKEALEKVGDSASGADFLWIQRYFAHELPARGESSHFTKGSFSKS